MKKIISLMMIFFFVYPITFSQNSNKDTLPASIDLSQSVYFPPITDQGKIGSCDWHAAAYYQMTYMFNNLYHRQSEASNTFSPKFGYNILNNGGEFPYNIRIDDVYRFLQKHGCATMEEYPYNMEYRSWCTDAGIWENAINYRTDGYKYFTYKNRSYNADYSFDNFLDYLLEIKSLLAKGEVLVIQSFPYSNTEYKVINDDTTTSADDNYVNQIAIIKGNNSYDHTMAVVGYNDNLWVDMNSDGKVQKNEKGAIKIANSAGNGAANHNFGYLWMMYNTIESSIAESRVNRLILKKDYKPKVICRLMLYSKSRDKISFQFGRSSSNSSLGIIENQIFDPYGLGYNYGAAGVSLIDGANCSYEGTNKSSDGNFVFDLTDIYGNNESDYW